MSELKTLTLNGKTYDTFPDQTARNLTADKIKTALGFTPVSPDDVPEPSDEQIAGAVSAWLEEHPEATTTVADGSVTPAKTDFFEYLTSDVVETTISANGYNGWGTDYIAVGNLAHLYGRVVGYRCGCEIVYYDAAYAQLGDKLTTADKDASTSYDVEKQFVVTVYDIDLSAGKELGAAYVKLRFAQINPGTTSITDILSIHRTAHSAWNKPAVLQLADFYGAADLTLASFTNTGAARYNNPNLIDNTKWFNTGFSNLPDGFGQNANVFCDYVDVREQKTIYIRQVCTTQLDYAKTAVACYDADKQYLYNESTGAATNLTASFARMQKNVQMWDGTIRGLVVIQVVVPDEVAYVRISPDRTYCPPEMHKYEMVSYTDIYDLAANPETYEMSVSDEFIRAVEATQGEQKTHTMVMIGDSLTNWGGGGDASDGFLRVVHEKTGVMTTNEGLAGAWWQLMDGETADGIGTNGVGRVNAILADQRKYDLYCFMLGTNAGSNTDTGETSADPSTMCGAIRYCLEKLKAYDPTGQILVCLPPQRAEGNENQEKVNDVIKSIVESYGVRTLDIYHNGGIVPNTKIANVGYLSDGLHLGENGIQALGKALAAEVKYMLCI